MSDKFIDIESVLKTKVPNLERKLPHFVVSLIKKIVCEDQLNDLYSSCSEYEGVSFATALLDKLDISYTIRGKDKLPIESRVIFVSNHPLGGMDGIILLSMLGRRYGGVKSLVNDLLMYIKPMCSLFVPVNKTGSQSKLLSEEFDKVMKSDLPVLFFPAGMVSRRNRQWLISDNNWKKTFITKSKEYNRDIVPIYFDGRNSDTFYNVSYYRTMFGIKQNLELLLLPREMLKTEHSHFNITIGNSISADEIRKAKSDNEAIEMIRKRCYELSDIKN